MAQQLHRYCHHEWPTCLLPPTIIIFCGPNGPRMVRFSRAQKNAPRPKSEGGRSESDLYSECINRCASITIASAASRLSLAGNPATPCASASVLKLVIRLAKCCLLAVNGSVSLSLDVVDVVDVVDVDPVLPSGFSRFARLARWIASLPFFDQTSACNCA